MRKTDVCILGAGIVGVSAALQLQARGRSVSIVERRDGAGLETSFGNAGLIERSSIKPYFFPRDPARLLKYAFNLLPEAHYHLSALPAVGPWLVKYYLGSGPERAAHSFAAFRPLIENSLSEHAPLIAAAGAERLVRHDGWLKIFRHARSFDVGAAEADRMRAFGLAIDALDPAGVAALEPALAPVAGGLHFRDTAAIVDPGALSKAYADLFTARGGVFLSGDARTLQADADGWRVETAEGPLACRDAVVALGPWSDVIFGALGYRMPLAVKRGYHMHYRLQGNAVLHRPVLDTESAFLLAPMRAGALLLSQLLLFLPVITIGFGWLYWRLDSGARRRGRAHIQFSDAGETIGRFDYFHAAGLTLLSFEPGDLSARTRLMKSLFLLHGLVMMDLVALTLSRAIGLASGQG